MVVVCRREVWTVAPGSRNLGVVPLIQCLDVAPVTNRTELVVTEQATVKEVNL
jgi:hypothetical protein